MIFETLNHAQRYTLYGAAFGVCFPLFSTVFDSWLLFDSIAPADLLRSQINQPLLWVIDSAPLFLGWFARLGGRHYDKLKVSEAEREKLLQSVQDENDALEVRINERTDELRHAMQQAQQAAKAKSEFLANVSHELRTPMNGILGMGQLMKGTALNEQQTQYVDVMLKSGESLLTIINDMLDFSRLENRQMELSMLPMDLKAAIKEACAGIEKKCLEKSITLTCEYPDNIPHYVVGDAVRIHQVLMNLLDNAVKYTERGDIHVTVNSPVHNGKLVPFMISISDSGQGIKQALMKSLFNSFTQGDSGTARKHGGMGLGLAICKQMVRLMGGEIGVNSVEGRGSTFWVSLRLELAEQSHSANLPGQQAGET